MQRFVHMVLFAAFATVVRGQTAFPDHTIQDVVWNSGEHHTAVTRKILAPGAPSLPVEIAGTADAEFVSGTQVRLAPGFHAGGFTGGGRFRAYIDEGIGPDADLVIIAEEPYSWVQDNVVHVHQWEKLEVGLRLPQAYQDAISRFFDNYYPDAPQDYTSSPGNIDATYDLNPYADDSLQLVMTLTSPSNTLRMKWGFFMKEGTWSSSDDTAILAEDTDDPLHPYHIRFRMAPDEVGPWQFTLSLKAPHTSTLSDQPLPELLHTGYGFICEAPVPDNHGFLRVNQVNRRILQFEDGTSFFGLGTNMADNYHGSFNSSDPGYWYTFYQRDHDVMLQTLEMLHDEGGNFVRMWLNRHLFAPEWVNVGVYDHYYAPNPCQTGPGITYTSNCQYQCWAFDKILDQARANGIYVQLCIDPSYPSAGHENTGWGNHAYARHFLGPRDPVTGRYDIKRFFYADGDPSNKGDGTVFYYWKRKYKYLMSRWGYSVNIAAIEPFNETDALLTHEHRDLTGGFSGLCAENHLVWPKDDTLPVVLDSWISDLADHIRGEVDPTDPVTSPLGEDKKLFLVSYAGGESHTDLDHYRPFTNPKVDLLSVHQYVNPGLSDIGQPDIHLRYAFDRAADYRNTYPSPNASASERKPIIQGEHGYLTYLQGFNREIEKIFHNYDVSFHNEIWASAFSGKFASGTTWQWERVFWWPDAVPRPPSDPGNNIQQFGPFSNVLGDTNNLDLGLGFPIPIKNRRLHHHFMPLADLLKHPSWTDLGFFNGDYSAHKFFDGTNTNVIEAYYLKSADSTTAIGWVHNRNAWVMNNFYLRNTDTTQNFFGCMAPSDTAFILNGFLPDTPYHISWFATWMNSTVHPADTVWTTDSSGNLLLDLSTALFGDTIAFFLDTLRADYAFIITPEPFVKSMEVVAEYDEEPSIEWDFGLYPNPARDDIFLRLPGDAPKDIAIHDPSGRRIYYLDRVSRSLQRVPVGHLAQGIYFVWVSDGTKSKTKKFIIY